MQNRKFSPNLRAFTLQELLIVIAIIAVLLALLLPVVSSVLKHSKDAVCTGNLQNMGVALALYTQDHNGNLIPAAVIQDNIYWFDALNPYMGATEYGENFPFPSQFTVGGIFPLKWQQCPLKVFTSPSRECVGYGWNYLNFGMDPASAPGLGYGSKISQVQNPSGTIIIGDSQDITVQPNNSNTYQNRYLYPPYDPPWATGDSSLSSRRHSGRGFYLFLDGHVEGLTPEQESDKNLFTKVKSP